MSSILSEPSDRSPMAFPDYLQSVWDHRRALVVVSCVGPPLSDEHFGQIFRQISSVSKVRIPSGLEPVSSKVVGGSSDGDAAAQPPSRPAESPTGTGLYFRARYKRAYPVECNEWAEFQLHRRVLGVVSVGGYTNVGELEELNRLHEAHKVTNTIRFPQKF